MSGRSPVWHPFTQHAVQPDAIAIASAEGAWLEAVGGRRILDAISSWWVVTHGHRHPAIVAALKAQADRLDQVIFAGFTHEPAERLAEALIGLAPGKLEHVFFSDSGSTAVEVAMKMALGVWRNRGMPRTTIAAFEHGYHGDTTGAMSAGARGVFTQAYEPMLFDVQRIPFPVRGREQATIDAVDALCRTGRCAALIVEPLILGAGGMLAYEPWVLRALRETTARADVLLIADEVMTGWGRTGKLFACEHAGVAPDMLCTAKGITGGTLPLAATLATAEVFAAHYSKDRTRTFFHSSSYTANPICCAAALANVEVWRTEPVAERIARLCMLQEERVGRLSHVPRLSRPRRVGTITAVDVEVSDGGYLAGLGPELYRRFIAQGVLLRPLGNTIYVMPPYCVTAADLDLVYDAIEQTVREVSA